MKAWKAVHKSGATRIVLESIEVIPGGQGSVVDHSNYYIYNVDGVEIDHGK